MSPSNFRPDNQARLQNQRNVFDFLVAHFRSQEAFSKQDLEQVTTWHGQSFDTYWSKQFKQFMVPADASRFRVSEAFRPYATWEKFQQHVTQVRHVSSDYRENEYENVLIYESAACLENRQVVMGSCAIAWSAASCSPPSAISLNAALRVTTS